MLAALCRLAVGKPEVGSGISPVGTPWRDRIGAQLGKEGLHASYMEAVQANEHWVVGGEGCSRSYGWCRPGFGLGVSRRWGLHG